MVVSYKKRAINSLLKTAAFVESKNTAGAGDRWLEKIRTEVRALAQSKAKFAVCTHVSLAKFNYRCYVYKDWIIAFKISENKFEVCRFIWGARLA